MSPSSTTQSGRRSWTSRAASRHRRPCRSAKASSFMMVAPGLQGQVGPRDTAVHHAVEVLRGTKARWCQQIPGAQQGQPAAHAAIPRIAQAAPFRVDPNPTTGLASGIQGRQASLMRATGAKRRVGRIQWPDGTPLQTEPSPTAFPGSSHFIQEVTDPWACGEWLAAPSSALQQQQKRALRHRRHRPQVRRPSGAWPDLGGPRPGPRRRFPA